MRDKKRLLAFLIGILGLVLLVGACKKPEPVVPPPPPPPPPPPAPTATLTAEPSTIERGQSATLSWSSDNATELSIAPGVGTAQATGSQSVSPSDSTTYTLTAKGPGGSVTATARVTVTVPPPPPPPPVKVAPREITDEEDFAKNVRDAMFDLDRSDIRADAQQALTSNADWLKRHPNVSITIEGHCDERGSEEYNLGLGDRRATAAKNFLVNLGISADRLNTISYGKSRPQCSESTEDCWQNNRRAHSRFGR